MFDLEKKYKGASLVACKDYIKAFKYNACRLDLINGLNKSLSNIS